MTSTVDTAFESEFVHQVYDQIAQDFSRTRHSGWKFIEHFLEQLPAVRFTSPALFTLSRVVSAEQETNAFFVVFREVSFWTQDAGMGNISGVTLSFPRRRTGGRLGVGQRTNQHPIRSRNRLQPLQKATGRSLMMKK